MSATIAVWQVADALTPAPIVFSIPEVQLLKACPEPGSMTAGPIAKTLMLPLHSSDLPGSHALATCLLAHFRFPGSSTTGYALYVLHASPAAAVYLNGDFVGASRGWQGDHSDEWNVPLLLSLKPSQLHVGANDLLIELGRRDTNNRPLDELRIGPEESLYKAYRLQLWVQVTGVQIVSTLVGLIGLFAAVLWWRRRSDVIFGLFALSCALWIIRNAKFFLAHYYVPAVVFDDLTDAALFWLIAVLYRLSFRILEVKFPRIEAALFGYAAGVTVLMAVLPEEDVAGIATVMTIPAGLWYVAFLTLRVSSRRTVLTWLLWLAAIVTNASGIYDFLLQTGAVPRPAAYLMPYSAFFFAVTVGWALIDRFVRAHSAYERLNAELESRLTEKERELGVRYAQMAAMERDHAIALERERILRDMHDGLGLQLISSMRLVEKGDLSKDAVAALLGEALDEMRIAIDSVKPTARDLLLMLGNLRYRLEPRLAAAGITLQWQVGDTAGIEAVGPHAVAEITRIVQEVFSNAIKHSGAASMRLCVEMHGSGHLHLTVSDDGCGFDAAQDHPGEGLDGMRKRAAKIGARLSITSKPRGTRIELRLPVDIDGL